MNLQLGDHVCETVYKCSEKDKSCSSEIVCLETNSTTIDEKSAHILSESLEILNFSEDANDSQNCSCCSNMSCTESTENQIFTCHVFDEMQSTKKKLTFEWIKTMSSEISHYQFDTSLDSSNNTSSDKVETESDTDDSSENKYMESSPTDDSIIFMEDFNDGSCSDLTFCFADAVTEENCDSGFSFSTRGSLANCIDDDFLEDKDFELVFSTPMCTPILPDWKDVISEASELSQNFENEMFIDFFDGTRKSKFLKKINKKWESDTRDVDKQPREPVKVSFAPSPNLVTVHNYQKPLEKRLPYDPTALDQIRFKNRIAESSRLLSPILTSEHRKDIILRNSLFTCN